MLVLVPNCGAAQKFAFVQTSSVVQVWMGLEHFGTGAAAVAVYQKRVSGLLIRRLLT